MSRIADKLINNPEAAAEAGDGQSLHEPGTGEEQPLPEALAGEAEADQCLQESDRNAFDYQSSNFMDSDDIELLSWLEYPLDDFAFDQKHWPPPPPPFSTSPVPASPDFTCIPASSTLSAPSLPPSLSSSSASSSSISAVKHFPPIRDEAFMTGRDLDRRAVSAFEWSVQKEVETSEFWQEEQNNRMSGIQEAGAHDQGNMVDDKGALHSEWNRAIGERRAGIGTSILSRQAEPMLDELKPQFANVASNIKEPWLMKDVEMRLNGEVATIATPTEMRLNGEVAIATPTERLQARSHGNAALALGAGRAAGTIKPSGFEAFAKVRTSLQPIQPCNPPLGSPSSFSLPLTGTQAGKSLYGLPALTSTVASRALGFSASLHVNDITELHDLAQLYAAKVFAEYFNNNDFQKKQSEDQTIMGKSLRICVASSHVQPSMIGPVSDTRVEQPKEGTSNASAVDGTFASASGVTDMRKLSGGSLVPQEEEVLVVSSGGSQTSGSLRETASGSKRKLEDLDYQSEEAEGESGLSSQARTSTSKSSRANEVHNLSEKMRRNRINEKMNALRHLIPNASKSNKAALLDEAIAYLKNLQLQLQVLSSRAGMNVPQMPLPTTMPHMQTVPYNSLHGMGMGNYMAAGSALAAAGGSSTVGSIHSSYAVPGRPYNTSQPLPIPMSAAGMTLQPALAFDSHHEAAFPAAQAHHQLYVQPFHQVVSRVDPPTYNIYGMEEQQQQQRPQQQQQHQQPQSEV